MTERRFCRQHRVRIERREGASPLLVGYGAVFFRAEDPGTEYELWPGLRERVLPSAFDRALRELQDVRGLFNHNASQVLGRSAAKTMRLSVDAVGLRYEIDLPDTSAGKDMATLVERGDISGSSFAFAPQKVSYVRGDQFDVRELADVDVFDVGPVTFPAYESTSAGLRSADRDSLKREYDVWKAQHATNSDDEIAVRLALLRLDGR